MKLPASQQQPPTLFNTILCCFLIGGLWWLTIAILHDGLTILPCSPWLFCLPPPLRQPLMYSLPNFHTCWLNSDFFSKGCANHPRLNVKSLFQPMSKSLFSGGPDHVAHIINSSGLSTTWHSALAVSLLSGSYDSCTGEVPGAAFSHQSLSPTHRWWIAWPSLWWGRDSDSHTPDFYQLQHTSWGLSQLRESAVTWKSSRPPLLWWACTHTSWIS